MTTDYVSVGEGIKWPKKAITAALSLNLNFHSHVYNNLNSHSVVRLNDCTNIALDIKLNKKVIIEFFDIFGDTYPRGVPPKVLQTIGIGNV